MHDVYEWWIEKFENMQMYVKYLGGGVNVYDCDEITLYNVHESKGCDVYKNEL